MFALDPPLGAGDAATIGGLVATADSGPLRHRYGGVRDLVLGITLALSDGTIAKAGSEGDQERRGLRPRQALHRLLRDARADPRRHRPPAPQAGRHRHRGRRERRPRRARRRRRDARRAAARGRLARRRLAGGLRAPARALRRRVGGRPGGGAAEAHARGRPRRCQTTEDDEELWAALRAAQRAPDTAVAQGLRPHDRPRARHPRGRAAGGSLVSRAAHGLSWITLDAGDLARRATDVRDALQPRPVVLLDGPAGLRARLRSLGPGRPGSLAVMRRLKERFDTDRIFRPGAYVGGI